MINACLTSAICLVTAIPAHANLLAIWELRRDMQMNAIAILMLIVHLEIVLLVLVIHPVQLLEPSIASLVLDVLAAGTVNAYPNFVM